MKEKLRNLTNKRSFHLVMIIVIISIILFSVGIIVLRYNVEGETNMPFTLTKISIISSSEGIDKESTDTKWAFDLYQSNDIYLYIDKNDNYNKTEAINNIVIDNFNIEAENKENIKIYKPDNKEEKLIFKNIDENVVDKIEYKGDMESSLKDLTISNQGGLMAFRCSNNNIAEYKSNDEEINHHELLKKAGITNEQLKTNLKFDLTIRLEDGKEFRTTVNIELPIGNLVDEGTTSTEITDLSKYIFKRIKN